MKNIKNKLLLTLTSLSLSFSSASAFDCCYGEVHGFISQGLLKTNHNEYFGDSDDGMWDFHEVGINYCIEPCCDLWAGVQFCARDLGDIGNNNIMVDWAFLEYYINDLFSVRAGKVKLPLGIYNKCRDADVARTWIFYPQSVYNESYRSFSVAHWGISVFGTFCLPERVGDLEYEVTIGTFEVDKDEKVFRDGRQVLRNLLMLHTFNDTSVECDYSFVGQLIWNTTVDCLRFGGSYAGSRVDQSNNFPSTLVPMTTGSVRSRSAINVANVFGEWIWDCLTLSGEAIWFKVTTESRINLGTGIPESLSGVKVDYLGYYLMAEYCLSDCVTIGGYYAVTYPNVDDKKSTVFNYQKDYDITIRWDINDCFVAKFEYHHYTGAAYLSQVDNNFTAKEDWNMVAGKLSVAF